MPVPSWVRFALAAMAVCVAGPQVARSQSVTDQLPEETGFNRMAGQNVQPFFEGWQRMPDGHLVMWFGYLNRNFEEQPDVPIGVNNRFDLRADMGQPTHFYPRRHLFVFKVDLPNDWPNDKRLVWTVTSNGKTGAANGWLQPEWEVDEGVIQMNIGPGGAPPADPPNTAPKITVHGDQTVTVGKPLKLAANATDDGIPKARNRNPRPANAGSPTPPPRMPMPAAATPAPRAQLGLRIRWILYRAPDSGGTVSFDQESGAPVVGAQAAELATEATFSAPGTYWLRAIATDGLLETPYDLKVTVLPAPR
jgi:hypothetical protein